MHCAPESGAKRLSFFERYLSLWVALCIVAGVTIGKAAPGLVALLSRLEVSQVNLPIAVLIWLMIYPMMLRIDFAALRGVGRRPKGLLIVLFVNWLVKPFSMAFLGWLFFKQLFGGLIGPELGDQYLAGAIILAAAPCTAMVFVWSYLTDGDPAYTLVQVALNDLIMLVAFAPIVIFLLGVSNIAVPYDVLFYSVVLYIVIPLAAGAASRTVVLRRRGPAWFEGVFLPRLKPVSVGALLATLVLIFAFQGEVIVGKLSHIALIAIPLLIQVYFNSGLVYGLSRWLRVPHSVAAPGALIGASNFFELAVATAISLFGLTSGATLATVVGVLVEVPVMLSVCAFCNRTRHWFPAPVTRRRVLVLCTHNSARSQMAEGFLRALAGERFDVASAGTEATRVHPLAKRAMGEVGIDLSGHVSKTLDGFLAEPWDYVITVCDSANERCRVFPARTARIHWSFDDPSRATGSEQAQLAVFRRVRDEIGVRLRAWLAEQEQQSGHRISAAR